MLYRISFASRKRGRTLKGDAYMHVLLSIQTNIVIVSTKEIIISIDYEAPRTERKGECARG